MRKSLEAPKTSGKISQTLKTQVAWVLSQSEKSVRLSCTDVCSDTDELAVGVLGDLLQHLDQGVSELRDSLWRCYDIRCINKKFTYVLRWSEFSGTWVSQWHECLCYPGAAYTLHTRPGIVLHREEPRTLRISSWYLTAVRVPLAMTLSSVQTITDPPINWSISMTPLVDSQVILEDVGTSCHPHESVIKQLSQQTRWLNPSGTRHNQL